MNKLPRGKEPEKFILSAIKLREERQGGAQ